ncbi:MAG: RNA methyltransferase [Acholeplasmataceae bacterium]|nr:RNA methyltransferase [Acholeplasmataceae bacterium]
MSKLYLGLVHYPFYNKHMQVIATAVTNFDIHDIARTARTYDVEKYFVIHPLEIQAEIIKKITDYWQHGYGKEYNPDRSEALDHVQYIPSIAEAIKQITELEGKAPLTVTTDARTYPNTVTYQYVRGLLEQGEVPIFLLLGTGFGLEKDTMSKFDLILEPIWGPGDYNHLCVRSAAAIMLDRLASVEHVK